MQKHKINGEFVKYVRCLIGHTRKQASELVYVTPTTWGAWEHEKIKVNYGLIELYLIKTKQNELLESIL